MHTRPWICNFGSCVVPGAGAQSTLASDACIGDRLRTFAASEAVVTCVLKSTIHTGLSEIEMYDMSSTMYESTGCSSVEVYGATTPKLRDNQVKILSFNRFDHFRDALLENQQLEVTTKVFMAPISVRT